MCRLSARLDYREASEELSHQGIKVSHTILHQNVRKWSEALNVCEQVETQELEKNQHWYVSCDGCHTNSPDGWKGWIIEQFAMRCVLCYTVMYEPRNRK